LTETRPLSFIRCFNRSDRSDFGQVAGARTVEGVCHGAVQRALDERIWAFVGELQRERGLLGEPTWRFSRALSKPQFQTTARNSSRHSRPRSAILRRQPRPVETIEWAFMVTRTCSCSIAHAYWRCRTTSLREAWVNLRGVKHGRQRARPPTRGSLSVTDREPARHLRWEPPRRTVLD